MLKKLLFSLFAGPLSVEDLPKPSTILARMIAQEIVEHPDALQRKRALTARERVALPTRTLRNYPEQQMFVTEKCSLAFFVDDYYPDKCDIALVKVKEVSVNFSDDEKKIIIAARDIVLVNRLKAHHLRLEQKQADEEAAKQQKICDAIAAFQGVSCP